MCGSLGTNPSYQGPVDLEGQSMRTQGGLLRGGLTSCVAVSCTGSATILLVWNSPLREGVLPAGDDDVFYLFL